MAKKILISSLVIALLISTIVFINKDKSEEKEEPKKVEYKEISKNINTELRSLIPSGCNGYRPEIYKGTKDETTEFEDFCIDYLLVYTLEAKTETDDTNYYIYDYVLIYNNKENKWLNSFVSYLNDKVEEDDNAYPTDSSFKKNGKLYKYTFKKENNKYLYVSTEPVK